MIAQVSGGDCGHSHGAAVLYRKNRHGDWVVVAKARASKDGTYRFVVPKKKAHYKVEIGKSSTHSYVR